MILKKHASEIFYEKDNIENLKDIGRRICDENPFYNTLSLFLKCFFIQEKNLMNFVKDLTKNEQEFQTFMIFKEYALYVYHSKLEGVFNKKDSIEDRIYVVISYIKSSYDTNKEVIEPFIRIICKSKHEVAEKFNYIKTNYIPRVESLEKFKKLERAIEYLEEAKMYEEKAKHCNKMALEYLHDIKTHFESSMSTIENQSRNKLLSIENKI